MSELKSPIVTKQPLKILWKALGTLLLAAGFVVLVGRTPFISEGARAGAPSGDSASVPARPGPNQGQLSDIQLASQRMAGLQLPKLNLDPKVHPAAASFPGLTSDEAAIESAEADQELDPLMSGTLTPETLAALESTVSRSLGREGPEPTLGLFKARFNRTDGNPGYASEETAVTGPCQGAGQRYVDDVCPGCRVVQSGAGSNRASRCPRGSTVASTPPPAVLVWSHLEDDESVLRAVTRDCLFVDPNGRAIVGSLRFGSGDCRPVSPT